MSALYGEILASKPLGGRATGDCSTLFNPNMSWHMLLSSLMSWDDCGCENVNFARVRERRLQSERGHAQEHDPIGRLGWMCVFFCFYRGARRLYRGMVIFWVVYSHADVSFHDANHSATSTDKN